MTISTYAELQTAVSAWGHRSDVSAQVPDFIHLAESTFSRRLRTRFQELALAQTAIAANLVTIPANVVSVKSLWLVGYEGSPLKNQTLEFVIAQANPNGLSATYAVQGSSYLFDGTGTVTGVLYRDIPALSDTNTTNWLLTAAPKAYLYGALAELAIFTQDMENMKMWAAMRDSEIAEVQAADDRDRFGGALIARKR